MTLTTIPRMNLCIMKRFWWIPVQLVLVTGLLSAQDIRTNLTVFDNLGNSRFLTVGINDAATDSIDSGLGEYQLFPPAPFAFDARMVDTEIRTPSLLGNGVLLDLRPLRTPGPLVVTYELRIQRALFATSMTLGWSLPFATGITAARITSWPNASILNLDMKLVSQVALPATASRYLVTVTYDGAPLQRFPLNLAVNPPGKGLIIPVPNQPTYAYGSTVTLLPIELAPPNDCYAFSRWSGSVTGTSPTTSVYIDGPKTVTAHFTKKSYPISASTLSTFVVNPASPPPQKLFITSPGGACVEWTATSQQPWIQISKTTGSGVDSLMVGILTSAIPCYGSHAGTITFVSDETVPKTLVVPVSLTVGRVDLSAAVRGNPTLLSCETKAVDLIRVTVFNSGLTSVDFPSAPQTGPGFTLKNPTLFPLSIAPNDSATLYFEFAPTGGQQGLVTDNIIMQSSTCGRQVFFQLQGTRILPSFSTDVSSLDFGKINDCSTDPLPSRSLTIKNASSRQAALQYFVPAGMTLASAPNILPPNSSVTCVLIPVRSGASVFHDTLGILADFTICQDRVSVLLEGKRQSASFSITLGDSSTSLPAQLFDTTCVGDYSQPKSYLVRNTGTADLTLSLTVAAPFEIDAPTMSLLLPAGKSQLLNVRFHPISSGTFQQPFTITADQCNLSSVLSLRGTTFSQQVLSAAVTPAQVTLAECDSVATMRLTVTNTGTSPAVFNSLPSLPNGFLWNSSPSVPIVIPPGVSSPFEAYITFMPPRGVNGSFGGSVQWFGEPCGTSVYFTLSAERVLPTVQVHPAAIDFGIINFCDPLIPAPVRTLSITNTSTLPMIATAFAPAARYTLSYNGQPFPTAGLPVPVNGSVMIDVTALFGRGGTFRDTLAVELSAGAASRCTQRFIISLLGERYQPDFIAREDTQGNDFGNVCVNSTTTRTFILENIGDKQLVITSQGFSAQSPFQLVNTPFKIVLPTGASRSFAVRYTPSAAGTSNQSVTFDQDACTKPVIFSVKGTAVQPSFTVSSVAPPGAVTIYGCETSTTRLFRATVRNTGQYPVTISDGSLAPEGFRYDPPTQFPFTLQPGMTRDVTLRFIGTTPGAYGGTITLAASPCAVEASFPLDVTLVNTGYSVEPRELVFDPVTLCPGGIVSENELDKLTRSVTVTNNGEVPIAVSAEISPENGLVQILQPIVPVFTLGPGQSQRIVVGFTAPVQSPETVFQGAVNVTVSPAASGRCAPQVITVPFQGMLNRILYHVVEDSLTAVSKCANVATDMHATYRNEGTLPVRLKFNFEGSTSFTIADSATVVIPAGSVRIVTIRYRQSGSSDQATLVAVDNTCGYAQRLPLAVTRVAQSVQLSNCTATGQQPSIQTKPGSVIDIPIYISQMFECPLEGVRLTFEIHYDVFALTPVGIGSSYGQASFQTYAPGKTRVTLANASLPRGEIARLFMEVLVGRSRTTTYTLKNPAFSPAVSMVEFDTTCVPTINIGYRNGVQTLRELGLAWLAPPFPSIIRPGGGQQTTIAFTLHEDSHVELRLVNSLGIPLQTISAGVFTRGHHEVTYTPKEIPAGLYHVMLSAGGELRAQKLIIAR